MTRVNRRRLIIVGLVLLAALSVLLFSLRDVVREVVVIPLSYLFWLVGLFVRNTSQIFFWLAAVLIGLLVAYRSIRPRKKAFDEINRVPGGDSMAPSTDFGRVGFWLTRINALRMGSFYRDNFNHSISRLLLDVLSYRHHLPPRQVELALKRGALVVPPDVAEFVLANAHARIDLQPNLLNWLLHSIREWFLVHVRRIPIEQQSLLDPTVRRVITYMEEELEVPYGQSDR
jgi:hypothetical protein